AALPPAEAGDADTSSVPPEDASPGADSGPGACSGLVEAFSTTGTPPDWIAAVTLGSSLVIDTSEFVRAPSSLHARVSPSGNSTGAAFLTYKLPLSSNPRSIQLDYAVYLPAWAPSTVQFGCELTGVQAATATVERMVLAYDAATGYVL